MGNLSLVSVIVLLLGLSSVLFSGAVPISRSLKYFRADSAVQKGEIRTRGGLSRRGDVLIKGRMDMEMDTTDYSEPGANNGHDPITPSRV